MRNPTAIILGTLIAASVMAAPSPQLALSEGHYRLNGKCVSMKSLGSDETSKCQGQNFVGIVATDPTLPGFLFPRQDGQWLFQAGAPASYSNDGKTATYRISSVADTSEGRMFDLPGECVLNAEGSPTLTCAVRLNSGKSFKEATFEGDANWSFSRVEK
jgi:hypothetical protein